MANRGRENIALLDDVVDEPMPVDHAMEVDDDAELLDDDGGYDSHHLLTDEMEGRIKSMLTYRVEVYMSLDMVNTGFEKKMRFTILEPCTTCGVANHVDVEDVPKRDGQAICAECLNEKRFGRKEVYRVPIPIGARHGSTIVLPNKGHVYNDDIKGNVVVTLLDEPHEHFLRIFDDVIVCFQIDKVESIFGVTRMLTPPGCPDSSMVVIQTAPGCEVKDNDVFLVKGLGLPNQNEDEKGDTTRERGNLYILFFVRSKYSTDPIKLKNVKRRSCPTCDDTFDTEVIPSSGQLNLNGSSADCTREMKQNGVRTPRKRRRNGDKEDSPKSNPSNSTENPLQCEIPPPERFPPGELPQPFPDAKLSFLDRLVNHPGTIPLPFRSPFPEEIPMAELKPLWERYNYRSWWERVAPYAINPDTSVRPCPDRIIADSGAEQRRWDIGKGRCCPNCLEAKSLFDLEDDSVDSSAEAVKELLTGRISGHPGYTKIILECSLHRCKLLSLLGRFMSYSSGPKAQGFS